MRLLLLFIIAVFSYGVSAYQQPLTPGVWHLIGVNGFHAGIPITGFPAGTLDITIIDTNDTDQNATWDTLADGSPQNQYTFNSGDEIRSTVGLRIVRGSDSLLDKAAINYEKRNKDTSQAMLGMFVASTGEGRRSDLAIYFQEDYKYQEFFAQFDGGLIYRGVFDPKFTIGSPAVLELAKDTTVAGIEEVFDRNLSDNNISLLDRFDMNCEQVNCSGIGGRQKLTPGDSITAYSWDPNGSLWKIYNSQSGSLSGSFDEFERGQAYWIKIETTSTDPVGLILARSDLDEISYADPNSNPHWKLLSFNNSYLRQTPSAIFVPDNATTFPIMIEDSFHANQIILGGTNEANLTIFNLKAYQLGFTGKSGWNIRAYPASNGTTNGAIVISDEDFFVSGGTFKSIGGREIAPGYDGDQTPVNEHIIAFKLGRDLLDMTPKLAKIEVGFVGGNPIAVDLSSVTADADILSAINSAIAGRGTATIIDSDFDDRNDTIVIAATSRVYVRDETFVRLFDYTPVAGFSFSIRGNSEVSIDYKGTTAETVTAINAEKDATGVIAYNLYNNRVLLSSITNRNFDLKELTQASRFRDGYIYDETNQTVLGAVSETYSPIALASVALRENGKPYKLPILTNDLNSIAQFSPDFPIGGALYKLQRTIGGIDNSSSPDVIVSGVTRTNDGNSTIMWRQADLTVPPSDQRVANSRFNLYKLHKDRGYWVYMRNYGAQKPVTAQILKNENLLSYHYSNNFGSPASNETSPTFNQISLDISVKASGFEGLSTAQTDMPENVFLHIDGNSYPMIKQGSAYQYNALLYGHDLPSLSERRFDAQPLGIGLYLTNGLGSSLIDSRLTVDNRKPRAPTYAFDDNVSGMFGRLAIDPLEATKIYIYDGNLSDTGNNANHIYDGTHNAPFVLDMIGQPKVFFGTSMHPYYDLRIIGESANKLQSDTRRLYYAPIYKGSDIVTSPEHNATAIRFTGNGTSWQPVVEYGGTTPTNSGVQVVSLDGNRTIVAYPQGNAELAGNLPHTMTIKIGGTDVARISYTTAHANQLFYLDHNGSGKLGYGIFSSSPTPITYELNVIDSNQTIVDPSL
ncbi:hypothetical protein AGMMS50229_03780 [Campylobacterota bacterium]|nr:hypothetical protein AGMMS50229_03780 [Campylobacterota bacterium]